MENNNASNQDTELSELVTKYVHSVDPDDKSKLQLPDDMPDWQKAVIRTEKRARDAQAELSRTQVKLRESDAKNGVLMETASTMVPEDFQLNDSEIAELNQLKKTDADQYRLRVNALEAKAKEAQATKLQELTDKAATDATASHTSKNRVSVLADFREANPDLVITDDVLVNDVPPRLLAGVNSGEYSYGEYLNQVKTYLETSKKVPGKDGEEHNIHQLAGSTTPGKKAAENEGKKSYSKMTF